VTPARPGSEGPVTVLAVDDQPVFLHAVRMLIAATDGFQQIAEASSGEQALRLAANLRPDLVLVDVRMPGMDGIETARQLRRLDDTVVVILVSLEEVVDLPASLASAGAAAHIRKQELSPRALQRLWAQHGRPLAASR
jgi:two-component system, NarL family, invasion response regulator UvrY